MKLLPLAVAVCLWGVVSSRAIQDGDDLHKGLVQREETAEDMVLQAIREDRKDVGLRSDEPVEELFLKAILEDDKDIQALVRRDEDVEGMVLKAVKAVLDLAVDRLVDYGATKFKNYFKGEPESEPENPDRRFDVETLRQERLRRDDVNLKNMDTDLLEAMFDIVVAEELINWIDGLDQGDKGEPESEVPERRYNAEDLMKALRGSMDVKALCGVDLMKALRDSMDV